MKRIILIFLIGVTVLTSCRNNPKKDVTTETITLADASVVWWMAPSIIAQKDSLYNKNSLNVKSFDVQTGLASMNAVISGSADIGLVATTPLAMAAFKKENLIILGSYIESNDLLALINQKNSNDSIVQMPTEPIALVKGTISELYYYRYMQKHFPNQKLTNINQLNVKPPDVPNSMKTGSAKSTVIWEPFGTIVAEQNSELEMNRDSDIYTMRLYIVTKPETLEKKEEAIRRFVKSIEDACQELKENPDSKITVLKSFPTNESSMNQLWDKVNFEMKYDYDNMKNILIQEAQTLYELGYTPKDNEGNLRKLTNTDISHYFNHSFKQSKDDN